MSPAIEEKEAPVQSVTFYSWMGTVGRPGEEHACPSGQVVNISGGNSQLAKDGSKVKTPVKEAKFHNGRFETSDPEIITALRKIMKHPSSGISEDVEEFYAATMTPQQRANRQTKLGQKKDEQIADLSEENSRLRKMLEEKGSEEMPRRSKPAA